MSPSAGDSSGSLRRVLSRRDLILYGLVILTPTAPYPVFGLVQQTSHGHSVLSYLIAMVAMLFTAMSYGRMSGAFPSAGSTYTYVSEGLHPVAGFLAGWAMILDYMLIPLLSVVYASLTANRMLPSVPYAVWAVLFTISITLINLRGMRVTKWAGNAMMALMSACAVLFLVLASRYVVLHGGAGALLSARTVYDPSQFSLHPLMLGAAIASLSFIGFDAISTLAEDTLEPERDISFATVAVCLIETVFCVATVYVASLVAPDFAHYAESETVILDVGNSIGGIGMLRFISFILLVAGLASALTGQAGASRLLLGMGRDGVLSRRFFAYVDPKHATPVRSIYLMGFVSLVGSLALRFQLVVELLNFGAFFGFILVNLSVIRHFFLRNRTRASLLTGLICPALGALVCTYIWLNLTVKAQMAGFGWLAVGGLYLAVLTGGFRRDVGRMQGFTEGA
jgi:putrescine importer